MHRIGDFLIHSFAFFQKEVVEILRQTRLILALILGPFLIMLLFGIGYQNQPRVLRTIFVIPADETNIQAKIQQYAISMGGSLSFQGITTDQTQAIHTLEQDKVDVVAVIPDQIAQQISNSQQPTVTVFHREIDPLQVSYIQYFVQIYVDELNRRILLGYLANGQQGAASIQKELQTATAAVHSMRLAFQQGNAPAAEQQRQNAQNSLGALTLGLGMTMGVLQGIQPEMNSNAIPATGEGGASQIVAILNDLKNNSDFLAKVGAGRQDLSAAAQKAAQMEKDLTQLGQELAAFRQMNATVLVSPFKGKAENITGLSLTSSDFLTPGVIVLLLQHLAVTFAALSIVRERLSGTMELFRVAPLSAFEVLVGKYLSYMVLCAALGAIVSALVVLVLHVPMLGNWWNYAAVLAALLFTSLGFGFVFSLLSETNSQAVQYSMLILLFSIFFSGFFVDLRLMQPAVRTLAWFIPATYGMNMLQEIMFRANAINLILLGGQLGIGLLLFLLNWFLLRREMKLN